MRLDISAWCTIANNRIQKNGGELFRDDASIPVTDFLVNAYKSFQLDYPKFYKMDGLSKLGWLAAEVLLKLENITERYSQGDIALVLSNRNSSLDTDIRYFETTKSMASPALFVYTLPNIVMGEICIRHGFKGENALFVFEKFESAFLSRYVQNLVEANDCKACVCGWVDLLANNYNATLFLIEKSNTEKMGEFSPENIQNIYESTNG
ncbi:MAG: hypothetical protein H7Y27_00165 [Gemmatimonadaceae bacterium]|nr:hypothetical protein [Chitinophagaceae bacterium]